MITTRWKKLSNGAQSAYFDIHWAGRHWYEFLKIHTQLEKGLADREANKELRQFVEKIKAKRVYELQNELHGISPVKPQLIDFFVVAMNFIDNHTGCKKGLTSSVKKLKEFLGKDVLYLSQINEQLLFDFYKFLQKGLNGETPFCYFKKIRSIIKYAHRNKLIKEDYGANIRCKRTVGKPKDILSPEELRRLFRAHCPNIMVKVAFLFSCLTGSRWSDIIALTGDNIKDNILQIRQQKTKHIVTIILNENTLKLIRPRINGSKPIFKLCSHTAALKNLRVWCRNAGIDKHITYHSSRHTYACNLLASGCSIFDVSKLLGHTQLKHTVVYTRENLQLKMKAVNNMENIFY